MLDIKDKLPKDENGLAHGEWLYYYFNGNLMYRHNHVHGIRHGLHEGYEINGELIFRGYVNMGRRLGLFYRNNEKLYYLCLI